MTKETLREKSNKAEKYISLKAALDSIHHELQELYKNSFIDNNYQK
ncbi:14705_t:CDS:2 [Cetraspora pellucida]|uniref:14705_t:CDS:1 n=1 Tax=Cetraspora pellucida TaxID=1433469 RepID=A0A9N9C5U4_9GLOM|nr:14705_t:CDS:2 [Cetraspora pellucida]